MSNVNIARLAWSVYKRQVYKNEELIPIQEQECQRAFYAGMHAAIMTALEISDEEAETAGRLLAAFHNHITEAAKETLPEIT